MYCTKCGTVMDQSAAYCAACGTPTDRATARAAGQTVRLTRSIYDTKIAGVCGGLARYMAVDPTFMRLIWLVATICFPPLLLGYIAAWIIVPREWPAVALPLSSGAAQTQS